MPPDLGEGVRRAAERQGISVSAWLSEAAADRLRNELAAVVKMPDIAARLVEIGQTPIVNTPEEFMANYQADFPRWEALIKAAGVTVE